MVSIAVRFLFDGRFSITDTIYADIDTGLGGLFVIGSSAAFLGSMGFGVAFELPNNLIIRPYAGMDFTPNPYYSVFDQYSAEFVIWFHGGVGFVIPQ